MGEKFLFLILLFLFRIMFELDGICQGILVNFDYVFEGCYLRFILLFDVVVLFL